MILAHKIFVIFFVFMMINLVVFAEAALSLGSVQVSRTAEVNAGETAQLKLLLFNVHEEEDLIITTGYEAPGDWSIQISPSEFNLPYKEIGDRDYEEGYEFIGTGAGDVKAKSVWIIVSVPSDENTGTYKIKVNINARKQTSGISMSQSRNFVYTINVIGKSPQEIPVDEDSNEESGEKSASSPPQQKQDNKQLEQETIEPSNNFHGITEEDSNEFRRGVENQIDDITGMIISEPMITPIILIIIVLMFIIMKYFKRI